jgi:hypothetical protein|tara:strand:- start:456 stop:587 length:132 start_codon:yes stop_codon:yes gene_type:complete
MIAMTGVISASQQHIHIKENIDLFLENVAIKKLKHTLLISKKD